MGKPETANQVTESRQVKSFSAQHKKEIRAAQERGEKIPVHILEEYKGEEWADRALESIKEAELASKKAAQLKKIDREYRYKSLHDNLLFASKTEKDKIAEQFTEDLAKRFIKDLNAAPGDDLAAREALYNKFPTLKSKDYSANRSQNKGQSSLGKPETDAKKGVETTKNHSEKDKTLQTEKAERKKENEIKEFNKRIEERRKEREQQEKGEKEARDVDRNFQRHFQVFKTEDKTAEKAFREKIKEWIHSKVKTPPLRVYGYKENNRPIVKRSIVEKPPSKAQISYAQKIADKTLSPVAIVTELDEAGIPQARYFVEFPINSKPNVRPTMDAIIADQYLGSDFTKKAQVDKWATPTQKKDQTKPELLPEDIENIKRKFKGQEIEEAEGGKVRIKLKDGATITVTGLDKNADNDTILTARGEVLGKTKGTEIKLNLSKADETTLTHEIKHALDNLGVISRYENRLIETEFLRRKQKGTLPFEPSHNPDKNIAREENIAEMFSHMLKEREQYRKGAIGRLVQKTGDIIDALKHVGQASLRKLALEAETGKVFERQPVGEIKDTTRYKVDEKVPPEKVEKDFLETRDSLARSFVNMIEGNAKFRDDVFKNDKEDLHVVENILGSTMFNAIRVGGAYKRLYDRVLVKIPDFKLERQRHLRGEGDTSLLKPLTDLKKTNKILYRRLNNYIVGKDINAEGYKVVENNGKFIIKDPKGKIIGKDKDFDSAYLKAFEDEAENTGFSDLEKDALIAYRKMALRLYHHYADAIKDIVKTCKEAGTPVPKAVVIENGKNVKIDLQTAMKKMGERIGYYFPRERQRGSYRVDATKDGAPTKTQFFKTKVAARTYKEEMVKKGYSVELSNVGLFSEDLFQDLAPLLAQEQIINKALEKIPEGTDVKEEIAKAIAKHYSALLKSHGSRARMIRRSDAVGDEVKRGYETDLIKAIASATEAAAGGWAKQRAAIEGIKIITGRDIPFEEYLKDHPDATKEDYYKFCEERKIDASRQEIIYKEATAALKDVLRNNELADNVIGAVKSAAVVKFIGVKIISSAVNLTTLLTSVPATLKGELEIPWKDSFDALGKAVGEYAKFRAYRLGNKLNGKGKNSSIAPLFDRIEERGFDEPQYNREAVDALEGRLGIAWRHVVDASMYLFGATERVNRATTIAATYMAIARKAGKPLFEKGKVNDEWLDKSRQISNQAHGSYGKDDRLHMARGTSLTARLLQLYTVFMKFSHTYLQEFVRLGAVKKQYGAALYMALSPMIFGGVGATIPMAVAKLYHKLFDTPEDPEETFLRAMGNSDFLRYGIPAAAGISLKGSLVMNLSPPEDIIDVFGAPGSLVSDVYDGVKNLTKGYYERAAEDFLPSGLAKIPKAYREYTKGVTTASGKPIFFGSKKLKLSKEEAWKMAFSFNPMGIDKKRTILYNEYEKKKWFRSKKADIYKEIRLFYSVPEEERSKYDAIRIKAEISNFNALIKKYGAEDFVTPIGSLKRLFREINLPPKRERLREVAE